MESFVMRLLRFQRLVAFPGIGRASLWGSASAFACCIRFMVPAATRRLRQIYIVYTNKYVRWWYMPESNKRRFSLLISNSMILRVTGR